ncbi:Allergen V5/Tpx-1 related protein [Patulibacter medicamentivorans]|uniref:Allergen V5/Tpx-1 related protein n=1 Tax=Patulibacter medicamentivorans TaxID=1097667 RepID=H0E8L8_9ACTN|nr:CAP domain-containing protein [Patulibacter medicamentivorans]EHN10018.1 Allergen V5/Tpx-1 related protein [Patulibacter medicamentivorans]
MPRTASIGAVAVTAALLLLAPAAGAAGCPGADTPAAASQLREVRAATLCLIGEQRAAAGLRPLHVQSTLQRLSRDYAHQMVRQGFFSHTTPGGSTFVERLRAGGYPRRGRSWRAAENLAWATGRRSTPRRVVAGWMASSEHRRNILDPRFRDTGLAVVAGTPGHASGRPRATFVQQFGVRR